MRNRYCLVTDERKSHCEESECIMNNVAEGTNFTSHYKDISFAKTINVSCCARILRYNDLWCRLRSFIICSLKCLKYPYHGQEFYLMASQTSLTRMR